MIQQLANAGPFISIRDWVNARWLLLMRIAIITGVLSASAVLGTRPRLLYLVGLAGIAGVVLYKVSPGLGVLLTLIGGMVVPFYGPSGVGLTQAGLGWHLGCRHSGHRQGDQMASFAHQSARAASGGQHRPLVCDRQAALVSHQSGTAGCAIGRHLGLCLFGLCLFSGWQPHQGCALARMDFMGICWRRLVTEKLYADGSLGSLFYLWLVCIPFGQVLFNTKLKPGARGLLLLITMTTLYVMGVPAYDWKSGWMPAAAGFVALVALRFGRLAPIMAVIAAIPAFQATTSAILTAGYSYSTRLDAWTIVLQIVKVNPITGLGPANYYWYTPLFPIRGYAVNFNSHSQYVDIVAQTGILGLILFFVFIWQVTKLAWSLRNRVPEGFAKGYVYSVLGGLAGSLVASWLGDWLLPFVYNVGLRGFRASVLSWIFLGGLVLLDRTYPAQTEST